MENLKLFILFTISIFCIQAYSQNNCYSHLRNDTLVIGNSLIERKFIWNNGNLITYSLTDKIRKHIWLNKNTRPDFHITNNTPEAIDATFSYREITGNTIHPAFGEGTISFTLDELNIKRIFRIYDNCPAIACDTYLKGYTNSVFGGRLENTADKKNIEFTDDMKTKQVDAVLDQFHPGGNHWQMKTVEFYDVTDWNNNLVFETNVIPYRKNSYRGNLLFAHNPIEEKGFFFLKEAPCSSAQLAYNGNDFTAEFGHYSVTGLGINERDLKKDEWVKAYSVVTGVYSGGELEQLNALRSYQKNLRTLLPERDEMVMMNTWGDRSQDSKVNEKFSLIEVERAAELGMTHFQIDDGWQAGRSPNSAIAKGSFQNIWDNPDYWKPDPIKYPRGLQPVIERGTELGVEVCLWFNPSVQNDYVDWEKDAQAMTDLYDKYGISTFKIDGLAIPTKESEKNLRKLFDKVLESTNNNAVFNLDATAGRRAGYHMFNEYGNIFLENRYTDWGNYYPYHTLRNLWQLAKYVPAEKLQIEFLNKWRNADRYDNDPFAPSAYSFEYLFAITMAGQPLAWFEGSGLPDEALSIKSLINKYKAIQHDFHSGTILPIGDEPSGKSWTGFQSLNGKHGYLLIFREKNPEKKTYLKTWLIENTKIKCTPILENGKSRSKAKIKTILRNGNIEVELPNENDFVLYKYQILK
ncbi:MAG: alpha-galactosidase [Paludibacteraceae bacterium]